MEKRAAWWRSELSKEFSTSLRHWDKMLFSPISAFYTWSTCSFDLCADHMGPFSGLKLVSFAVPPTSPAPLPANAFTSAEGEVSQPDSDQRRIIGTI